MVCNFVCGSIPRALSHLDPSSLFTLFSLSFIFFTLAFTLFTPLSHSLHTLFHSLHTLFHSLHTLLSLSSHPCLTLFTLSSHPLPFPSHSLPFPSHSLVTLFSPLCHSLHTLFTLPSHSLRCDKQVRVRRRHHDRRCQGKRARVHLCGYERYEAPSLFVNSDYVQLCSITFHSVILASLIVHVAPPSFVNSVSVPSCATL
jgi:hypothetical protein